MANTYRKVYLHLVFSVKRRAPLINPIWDGELYKYIAGILNSKGHYPLAINGHYDHIHILFDYACTEPIPALVREIKKSSTSFIREKKFSKFEFSWQSGYGIFSCGHAEKSRMINYVLNQKKHHSKVVFKKEYLDLLRENEISFDKKYALD